MLLFQIRPTPHLNDQQLHSLALTCLVGVVVVGIFGVIALKIRSWYRKDSGSDVNRDQLLLQFHELKRQGGLSEDEYRKISGSLVAQPAAPSTNGTESVESSRTASRNPEPDLSSD